VALARSVNDRFGESLRLANLSQTLTDADRYAEGQERARSAAALAEEIGSPATVSVAYENLAQAQLYAGDLSGARTSIQMASRYDDPSSAAEILALLGVIALLDGDRSTASEAFDTRASPGGDHARAGLASLRDAVHARSFTRW
jgi:hypothetical protein